MAKQTLKVVIKIGSSSLEDEQGYINYNIINRMMKTFSIHQLPSGFTVLAILDGAHLNVFQSSG